MTTVTRTDFDFSNEHEAFRAELRQFLHERLPDDWQGIFVEGDEGASSASTSAVSSASVAG